MRRNNDNWVFCEAILKIRYKRAVKLFKTQMKFGIRFCISHGLNLLTLQQRRCKQKCIRNALGIWAIWLSLKIIKGSYILIEYINKNFILSNYLNHYENQMNLKKITI